MYQVSSIVHRNSRAGERRRVRNRAASAVGKAKKINSYTEARGSGLRERGAAGQANLAAGGQSEAGVGHAAKGSQEEAGNAEEAPAGASTQVPTAGRDGL
jgi:hypothetical protein